MVVLQIVESGCEEVADGCRDLRGMRFQREVPGVEKPDNCSWDVALESAPRGRKNGSFLPHTARNGGLWVRK
jgi:hypothetical protein